MKNLLILVITIAFFSCKEESKNKEASVLLKTDKSLEDKSIEVITSLGDTIYSFKNQTGGIIEKYEQAKSDYELASNDAEAIIWYGRRTAYLGRYTDAIAIFSEGIEKHPENPKMYRHRGHRYITIRKFKKAIADFEKAVSLIEGTEDEVEPDGVPNPLGIPVSTLHGNIWYHLALVYYLENDMDNALRIYLEGQKVAKNDDNIVSRAHWLYMTYRRMHKTEEAKKLVEVVKTDMNVIENMVYHKMCLFYKGAIPLDSLKTKGKQGHAEDAILYGLGNWYLYNGEVALAKATYEDLLAKEVKLSFAYIAAEADYTRLFKEK
ncbi:MAG: tetratricopeptide repeat protein [Cellulophaga sp.]